jgi:hypothetical protein
MDSKEQPILILSEMWQQIFLKISFQEKLHLICVNLAVVRKI